MINIIEKSLKSLLPGRKVKAQQEVWTSTPTGLTPSRPGNTPVLVQEAMPTTPGFTVPSGRRAEFPQVRPDAVNRFHMIMDGAKQAEQVSRTVTKQVNGDKRNKRLGDSVHALHQNNEVRKGALTLSAVQAYVNGGRQTLEQIAETQLTNVVKNVSAKIK